MKAIYFQTNFKYYSAIIQNFERLNVRSLKIRNLNNPCIIPEQTRHVDNKFKKKLTTFFFYF